MAFPQIFIDRMVAYDIETIINITTFCFYSISTKEFKTIVLFDDFSQITVLYKFLLRLRKNDNCLVGFNCLNFDSQILEYLISEYDEWIQIFEDRKKSFPEKSEQEIGKILIEEIVLKIYNRSQALIKMPEEERFQKLVPEWKLNITHIDLYKQKHYDNKNKATSLKWLEFSIRFDNVQEMPIPHDVPVTKDQIEEILNYNKNDTLATAKFFELNLYETVLRIGLSEKYNINLINASEPRLAKSIFAKFLCDEMDISPKKLREMKSFRDQIDLEEIIFSYTKFKSQELNDVLYLMKNAIIFPMGGADGKDSPFYLFKDPTIRVRKNPKKGKPNDLTKFEHFFKYGNIDVDVGLGGIHACCESGIYEATGVGQVINRPIGQDLSVHLKKSNWIIHDIDVVSFYPNLAIKNNVKPNHLGESFSKIYEQIFVERTKIPKKDPVNYVYKIILNSTYGLSKEINSYLYDPKFTYSITINGQLSILMLVEMLWLNIPGIKIYQENTDGITVGYQHDQLEKVLEISKQWCEITKLQIEHAFYKKMIIVDVNNYIAIYTNKKCKECDKENKDKEIEYDGSLDECPVHKIPLGPKVKKKGLFETKLDFHKNASNLIVPLALEAYYVYGNDYKKFIENHTNMYDFFAAVKKKSDFKLVLKTIKSGENGSQFNEEDQQKVTRFYASKNGGRLVKKFKSGKLAGRDVVITKDSLVTIANKVDEETNKKHLENVNFSFYIKETEKVIHQISPPSKNQITIFDLLS